MCISPNGIEIKHLLGRSLFLLLILFLVETKIGILMKMIRTWGRGDEKPYVAGSQGSPFPAVVYAGNQFQMNLILSRVDKIHLKEEINCKIRNATFL